MHFTYYVLGNTKPLSAILNSRIVLDAASVGRQGWEGYFGNVIGYRLLVTLFKT